MTQKNDKIERARNRLRKARKEMDAAALALKTLLEENGTVEFPVLREWVRILPARPSAVIKNHFDHTATVIDLAVSSDAFLLRLPNFGRKSLREVKEALAELHLTLCMTRERAELAYIARST